MMALVVWLGTFCDADFTLSMALDSQSDKVGFDEVYKRTRGEEHKVSSSVS